MLKKWKVVKTIIEGATRVFLCSYCVFVFSSYAQQSAPNIVNYYPQCDYKVIDTVTVKQRINVEADALNHKQYQRAFTKIVIKLQKRAIDAKADEIVFIDKLYPKARKQNYLAFSAELIKACEKDTTFPKTLAKFNTDGMAQLALPTSTLKIENKLVINMPALAKRLEPMLLNNNVNIEGAYGVMLNDSTAHVIDILGMPSVDINPNKHSQILMYGRQHFFEFTHNKLRAVHGHNSHFTSDLKNLLEFDERFDDAVWQVEGKYTKQKPLTAKQAKRVLSSGIVIKNDHALLRVLIEKRSGRGAQGPTYLVDSFSLTQQANTVFDNISPLSSAPILAFISSQLKSKTPSILISDIPYSPTITAWLGPGKQLYTFGQHVAIEAIGDRVSTVHIFEDLYLEDSPFYVDESWQLGNFKQGMSAEAAQLIAGDKGAYFSEELEIVENDITQKLYFFEQKKQVKLYEIEINFY